MLDVGLYRLYQQVACQRYRQTNIDAKTSAVASLTEMANNVLRGRALQTA